MLLATRYPVESVIESYLSTCIKFREPKPSRRHLSVSRSLSQDSYLLRGRLEEGDCRWLDSGIWGDVENVVLDSDILDHNEMMNTYSYALCYMLFYSVLHPSLYLYFVVPWNVISSKYYISS